MSRLEQMRERFLRKIHDDRILNEIRNSNEQKKFSDGSVNRTKSTINLSSTLMIQKKSSVVIGNRFRQQQQQQQQHTTISRHRSLNNVSIQQPDWITRNPQPPPQQQYSSRRRRSSPPPPLVAAIGSAGGSRCSSSQSFTNNSVNNSLKRNYSMNREQQKPSASSGSSWSSSRTTTVDPTNRSNNSNNHLLQCKHCKRKFSANERLVRHQDICERVSNKHRPVFQSSKQRLCQQLSRQNDSNKNDLTDEVNSPAVDVQQEEKIPEKEPAIVPEWKRRRERFLAKIKMDRMKKNNNGKNNLFDLIQIEISTTPNLICCKRCERKFGLEVIHRHETFCNGR